MKVIDMHCHMVPAGFPAAPPSCCARWPGMDHRENNTVMVMMGKTGFRLLDHRCWDTQRRLADMDEDGVASQVLSPMPELLSLLAGCQGDGGPARHINGAIAQMIDAAMPKD